MRSIEFSRAMQWSPSETTANLTLQLVVLSFVCSSWHQRKGSEQDVVQSDKLFALALLGPGICCGVVRTVSVQA